MVGGRALGGEMLNPAPFRLDVTRVGREYSRRQLRLCNRTASRKRNRYGVACAKMKFSVTHGVAFGAT